MAVGTPSEARRSATSAGRPVALLVVDDGRRCLEGNLAACRLLGLSRDRLLGSTLDDILPTPTRERLQKVWEAMSDGGGHAGPFEVAAPAQTPTRRIEMSVTFGVLPGRHLVTLAPMVRRPTTPPGIERPSLAQASRRPTAREREILSMLAAGATDVQIARELTLSPATVQTHVRNAKAKLGARTRAQAVAVALRAGMISSEPD